MVIKDFTIPIFPNGPQDVSSQQLPNHNIHSVILSKKKSSGVRGFSSRHLPVQIEHLPVSGRVFAFEKKVIQIFKLATELTISCINFKFLGLAASPYSPVKDQPKKIGMFNGQRKGPHTLKSVLPLMSGPS
ncbi:hypothetical protein KP509_12G002300 [Ceratopteris richardii]|uniref:Uncharacterized protein n=2 Tax=Ceratopteris richardii TaxID=49495 RepID=A0A8T2TLM7_CERRI|nr:hypothetical protein KP509_12G002300 [Ceratopteris richardii]